MALYIPHSIFHMARFLYVRPETFWTLLHITNEWQIRFSPHILVILEYSAVNVVHIIEDN